MHTLPPAVHAMPNLQQTVDPDLTRRTASARLKHPMPRSGST